MERGSRIRDSYPTTSVFVVTAVILLGSAAPPARAQLCVLNEEQKLITSDAAGDDHFGSSVSMSVGRAVVGAWLADNAAGRTSGAAYVFRRADNGTPLDPDDDFWVEEDKLTASNAVAGDLFGWSVSISGNRAVVGARFHNSAGARSGSAYVFRHNDNGTPLDPGDDFWVQEDELAVSDPAAKVEFGNSVAISGDRAIVGAFKDDGACLDPPNPDCDSGSAYVFRRDDRGTPENPNDDVWIQSAKLTASDMAEGDMFGMSVSISGGLALVGSWLDDDDGTNSGSAYVYRHDNNNTPSDPSDDFWVEEAKLTASDAATFDEFGFSVSINNDRALVGSWLDDDAGSLSGSAYVFRRDDGGTPSDAGDDFWVQEAKLTASDAAAGDEFGKSVSIIKGRAAVGSFEDDDACADDPDPDPNCDSGSAYVFRHDTNGTPNDPTDDFWVEIAKLTSSDTAAADFFGRVAIDDREVLVGSLDDEAGEDAGSLYIFSVALEDNCPPEFELGDCDLSGAVDLVDFQAFHDCMTGSGSGPVAPNCLCADFDEDQDVDLHDFAGFQLAFTTLP
ncbi:MAG: FG-GAP repeat protein [Phycisphaerae bacterium]